MNFSMILAHFEKFVNNHSYPAIRGLKNLFQSELDWDRSHSIIKAIKMGLLKISKHTGFYYSRKSQENVQFSCFAWHMSKDTGISFARTSLPIWYGIWFYVRPFSETFAFGLLLLESVICFFCFYFTSSFTPVNGKLGKTTFKLIGIS